MSRSPSSELSLRIFLPPGILPDAKARKALQLCLESYTWIDPASYGVVGGSKVVTPGRPFLDEMVGAYKERGSLFVAGRNRFEGLSLQPSPIYAGHLDCWWSSGQHTRSARARDLGVRQIAELMRLLDSPLAYEGLHRDEVQKTHWTVEGLEVSLYDYSEGLVGLFWRTFLGPPFVRLFGDRLASLPPGTATALGENLWLVEPYPKPADALTEDGKARERSLIAHLGRECFFDHERQLKATRRPELPFIDIEAALREHARPRYEAQLGKGSRQVEIELKIESLRRWADQHPSRHYPMLGHGMEEWARQHQKDPDFLELAPERIAEEARKAWDRLPAVPPASPPNPELDPICDALGAPAAQALQEVGTLARELESRAGDALAPATRAQIHGVALLAKLLSPRTPTPESEAPAGRKSSKRKKPGRRGS